MANGPSWNRLDCLLLWKSSVVSVTTLAVQSSTISHNTSLELALVPVALIGLCAASFWIWMLVDCLTNKKLSGCQRACWVLFILFTHLVGAIVYYFVRRSPQTSPIVFVSQPQREFMQPEGYRPYQEGYPSQHFHQDAQASLEPIEQTSMQSQARYEEIQLSYPEEFH
jgi:hypothetical protein